MQITRPRGEYIEKIVRDGNGRLVRLSFCVYENGGHVRARLLNATYLPENGKIENKILSLDGLSQAKTFPAEILHTEKVASPYFNSNLLNFLGSKPRAPTI
jgi:hypothetical protein